MKKLWLKRRNNFGISHSLFSKKMFHLTIVTAEQTTYEGDITMLVAPAVDGEIGILTNHHPLVTKLGPGALRIVKPDQSEERLFTSGGYLEVNNNKVTVLAEVIENIEAIKKEEAKAARERAQKLLQTATDDLEIEKLEKEIQFQMIRERLATIGQAAHMRGKEEMKFENEQ